jgi:hypothetical protein
MTLQPRTLNSNSLSNNALQIKYSCAVMMRVSDTIN